MRPTLLCLCALAWHGVALANWRFLGIDNGTASEYYDPAIDRKGATVVIRSFSQKTVPDMVPVYDPKDPQRHVLVNFQAEQSAYEFNCKENTLQLVSRTFYRDTEGRVPIVTHTAKDKTIEEGNSEFARQFRKSTPNPRSGKNSRLRALACGAP